MPKEAKPPKSTKLPRKLPEDPIARGVAIMHEATEREVGDTNISLPIALEALIGTTVIEAKRTLGGSG